MAIKKEKCNDTHNFVQIHDTSLTAHTLGQIGQYPAPPKPTTVFCTKCGKFLKLS